MDSKSCKSSKEVFDAVKNGDIQREVIEDKSIEIKMQDIRTMQHRLAKLHLGLHRDLNTDDAFDVDGDVGERLNPILRDLEVVCRMMKDFNKKDAEA